MLSTFKIGIFALELALWGGTELTSKSVGAKYLVGLVVRDATGGEKLCTGTLISPEVILTAAHCVEFERKHIQIHFTLDLSTQTPQAMHRGALKVEIHPEYEVNKGTRIGNPYDIALVKLTSTAPSRSRHLAILEVPMSKAEMPRAFVAGYGFASYKMSDGSTTGRLTAKAAVLERIESPLDNLIRFDQKEGAAGTCIGDSGAPAFAAFNAGYFVFGVQTSIQNDSGDDQCRGHSNFVSVAHVSDWLLPRAFRMSQTLE